VFVQSGFEFAPVHPRRWVRVAMVPTLLLRPDSIIQTVSQRHTLNLNSQTNMALPLPSNYVVMATAEKKAIKLNPFENFMLAGTAAAVSKTVAAPIERIKLLLQNQGDAVGIEKPYTGMMDIIKRVPQEQGVMSFWRGNVANVVRYFPTQALNFMFKDSIKAAFNVPKNAPFANRLGANVASGGIAGSLSLCVVYPLDFARTRLAMDVKSSGEREFKGTLDTILKTAKTSGWFKGGVYNGFTISCVGIIIYRGSYFGLYDSFAPIISSYGFWGKFFLGYAVTTIAGISAYPIDTIRRRMMMQSGSATAEGAVRYTSSVHAFTYIMKNEGMAAMFRGAGANIFRGLGGTLVLVGFDYFKKFYIEYKYGAQ
jgi:solute carrier family 25 (mitochondrial adenine nucleotide translocator), member 4/5/6/31